MCQRAATISCFTALLHLQVRTTLSVDEIMWFGQPPDKPLAWGSRPSEGGRGRTVIAAVRCATANATATTDDCTVRHIGARTLFAGYGTQLNKRETG